MVQRDAKFNEPKLIERRRKWGYLAKMLLPDEYIVHVARLHWVVYVSSLTTMLFGVLILHYGTVPAELYLSDRVVAYIKEPMRIIAAFLIAVGALYVFFVSIRYVSTEVVVTNQRVIYKHGLIAPTVVEATITKISSVDIEQTVMGKLLDYGTITVRSSGQDIKPIQDIDDPYSLYYHVMHSARLELHPQAEEKAAPKPTQLETSKKTLQIPDKKGKAEKISNNRKNTSNNGDNQDDDDDDDDDDD